VQKNPVGPVEPTGGVGASVKCHGDQVNKTQRDRLNQRHQWRRRCSGRLDLQKGLEKYGQAMSLGPVEPTVHWCNASVH
jgi:hypothetical protein